MKIALLGAPGAGKSKFAKKLASSMVATDFDKPVVIDKYIEKLESKTGYKFYYDNSHCQNLQLIFHRWTLEQEAEKAEKDSITCGTMYESFVYSAIHTQLRFRYGEDRNAEMLQSRAAMTALGMVETQTFNYHAMFYLPYSEKTYLAKKDSFDTVVDQKIPEVLEGYFKYFIILDGTEKENLEYATKVVTKLRDEPPEDDESSVRGSGEPSPEEESLSDLQI